MSDIENAEIDDMLDPEQGRREIDQFISRLRELDTVRDEHARSTRVDAILAGFPLRHGPLGASDEEQVSATSGELTVAGLLLDLIDEIRADPDPERRSTRQRRLDELLVTHGSLVLDARLEVKASEVGLDILITANPLGGAAMTELMALIGNPPHSRSPEGQFRL